MVGPPGTGKTMLASRFAGILPPMTEEEALESAAVQSLTGRFDVSRWKARPVQGAPSYSFRRWHLLVAEDHRGREKFPLPIVASFFSMNCQSLNVGYWKYCVNHWSPVTSRFPARRGKPTFQRVFSWLPP